MPARICRWCISSGCICRATCRSRLMTGATLVTSATDASDHHNFERWNQYWRSGDAAKTAARRQRAAAAAGAGAVRALPAGAGGCGRARTSPARSTSSRRAMSGACAISSPRIFCDDIDCVDIAAAADIHPKYAMSVFRKSTGMTLNEYVNLLRLSYAQALLMKEDANVHQRRHGQRLRLAQRLQQIVPQARRHVAFRFPQGVGGKVASAHGSRWPPVSAVDLPMMAGYRLIDFRIGSCAN